MAKSDNITEAGHRTSYGVNPNIRAVNSLDEQGNPTGGSVNLRVGLTRNPIRIQWQNGPRAKKGTKLAEPNGAFVEDVIWAALQRLEFFNEGQYRDRRNSIAITKLEEALWALQDRTNDRAARGVEGKHKV